MSTAQGGWSCDMVQPGGCPGNDCGMMGDDSSLGKAATIHLPAELAGHEVVQHFLAENRDLKEAIRQSNHMLRERYKEFLQFQASHKEEKEFLMLKFHEARLVVEKLHLERTGLKKQLEQAVQELEQLKEQMTASQPFPIEKETSGAQEEPDTVTLTQGEAVLSLVPEMPQQKKERLEEDLKELQEANQVLQKDKLALQAEICALQQAVKGTSPTEEPAVKIKENGVAEEQPVELESLQGSGARNSSGQEQAEELCKRLKEVEDESSALRQQLASAREELVRLAAWEHETQQQLQTLSKQLEQAGEDKASVKAQVTSLLGELQESQSRLETCTQEKKELEERGRQVASSGMQAAMMERSERPPTPATRTSSSVAHIPCEATEEDDSTECYDEDDSRSCVENLLNQTMLDLVLSWVRAAGERLQHLEKEAEARTKQHSVQVDQLRLQVQNLESALRVERQSASEEKRKLAQLQVAYHQLFQEYDSHIKASLENEKWSQGLDVRAAELSEQLQQAEEALVAKQELIDKLKEEAEQHKAIMETVPVLKAQADIYKTDFLAERHAREKLHEQREALLEQVAQLQRDYEKLQAESEGVRRSLMEEMRNRHSEMRPQPQPGFPRGPAPFHPQLPTGRRQSFAEEPIEFSCPKCQYRAPDMDTLQIHVMDCIQ